MPLSTLSILAVLSAVTPLPPPPCVCLDIFARGGEFVGSVAAVAIEPGVVATVRHGIDHGQLVFVNLGASGMHRIENVLLDNPDADIVVLSSPSMPEVPLAEVLHSPEGRNREVHARKSTSHGGLVDTATRITRYQLNHDHLFGILTMSGEPGDSGTAVFTEDNRLIGLITGGALDDSGKLTMTFSSTHDLVVDVHKPVCSFDAWSAKVCGPNHIESLNRLDAARDHRVGGGSPAECLRLAESSLDKDPHNAHALKLVWDCTREPSLAPERRTVLEQFVKNNPDDWYSSMLLGICLVESGATPDGVARLAQTARDWPHAEVFRALGNVELGKDNKAAEVLFLRAVAANPLDVDSHSHLWELYRKSGDTTNMTAIAQQYCGSFPRDEPIWLILADICRQTGESERFREALKGLDPTDHYLKNRLQATLDSICSTTGPQVPVPAK